MTYYLIIEDTNKQTYEIGNVTLGGVMLAEQGWTMLKSIIEHYEDITFKFKIVDDRFKEYKLDKLIQMMEKIKIIEQEG